jgi:flagellar motility protein MotE (MotC chaperone)
LEKRKLESLKKAEEILTEEEKEIKEKLAKVKNQILILQKELKQINEEVDSWTKKLEGSTFPADELAEILDYTNQLSLKAQEVLNKIALAEEEEKKLKEVLSEKMKVKVSIDSVKKGLKDKISSEERAKEIRDLDEYTRIKRWFTAIIIFLFLSSPVQSKNLEKALLSPPQKLVKILKKREKELQDREAKLKVKEKFLQTLKDDVSFLLNVLDEKAQREESKAFGGGGSSRNAISISNEEIKKVYKVISRLPPDEGGQILSNVKPQIVAFLLLHVNSMQAANLLANMEVRHAANVIEILYSLAPEKAKSIFNLMDSSTKEEIKGVNSEK